MTDENRYLRGMPNTRRSPSLDELADLAEDHRQRRADRAAEHLEAMFELEHGMAEPGSLTLGVDEPGGRWCPKDDPFGWPS